MGQSQIEIVADIVFERFLFVRRRVFVGTYENFTFGSEGKAKGFFLVTTISIPKDTVNQQSSYKMCAK